MRSKILPSLSAFVIRSLGWKLALACTYALAGNTAPVAAPVFPEGLSLPSLEKIGEELGHKKDFRKSVDDFATALTQGNQSQALRRLCVRDEESCRLVKDFQEQAADAKRERLLARRRTKRFKITDKNIAQAQRFDFQTLVQSLKVEDESRLFSLAEKALKEPECPRNLSAALAIKAEEYFPFAKARTLSRELFEHARHCLQADAPVYERLFLRQGLYAYYNGDKDRAREMLLAAKKATAQTERYRVLYWLGRLSHEAGDKEKDNTNWSELMNEFPLSFYAIEAAASLKKDPLEMITQRKLGGMKREVSDDPELNRQIRWLEALYLAKKPSAVGKWASWIVRSNEDALDVDVLHYLSTLKIASGMYRSNISMLFSYFRKNPQALNQEGLKLLYPRPYFSLIEEASKGKIDTFFVMGLVRQESAFDPGAISRAKAKGLMQIIPGTARRLASGGHRKLLDEKENTKMGVKYLLQLGNRFNGSAELVLAAYNAGPMKVDEWLRRNPEREKDLLLWNDLIPFMETRDYVVSILRNNYLYTRLYGTPEAETAAATAGAQLFGSRLVKSLVEKQVAAKK